MTGDIHIPSRAAVTTAYTAMTSARSLDTATYILHGYTTYVALCVTYT